MDPRIREAKLAELQQWKETLNHLRIQEAAQGLTPDVEIVNGIKKAEKNIERINIELDSGEEASSMESYLSLLEMQIAFNHRLLDMIEEIQENRNRIDYLQAILIPGPRRRIALSVSNVTIALIAFLFLFPNTLQFGKDNPIESLVFVACLLFFAVLLRFVVDPLGGKEEKT